MTGYELWEKREPTGTPAGSPYGWMVWRVGPITGAEEWFDTEAEARAWIAEHQAADSANSHSETRP